MNPIPQPSEAKPDLARTLRESCVRFTEAADESFFFRRLYLLLAALFGKIEDMFLLWKAGSLPPTPARPQTQAPRAPTPSRAIRQRRTRLRRRASTPRPTCVRGPAPRRMVPTRAVAPLKPDAPARRIDRYPKS